MNTLYLLGLVIKNDEVWMATLAMLVYCKAVATEAHSRAAALVLCQFYASRLGVGSEMVAVG